MRLKEKEVEVGYLVAPEKHRIQLKLLVNMDIKIHFFDRKC